MKKHILSIALLAAFATPAFSMAFIASVPAGAPPASGAQPSAPMTGPVRSPGLYVNVLDGAIQLSNAAGAMNLVAGQFGFTAGAIQPPTVLPNNPGMYFSPPPSFNSSSPATAAGPSRSSTVDCVVR